MTIDMKFDLVNKRNAQCMCDYILLLALYYNKRYCGRINDFSQAMIVVCVNISIFFAEVIEPGNSLPK